MVDVIVALDVPSAEAGLRLLERLPRTAWVKIGSVLFTAEGPALVRAVQALGHRVFLDLKWHDIPNTVAGAVASAAELGVTLATVHTLGGRAMMAAAARAAGGRMALVGVTVLTSHEPADYAGVVGRSVAELGSEVRRLAGEATAAGLDGVVCSPHEIAVVRAALPAGAWVVVPGIRRAEDALGDQARVGTPAAAAAAGATHLVVGRPILQSPDPGAAFLAMQAEANRV